MKSIEMKSLVKWGGIALAVLILLPLFLFIFRVVRFVVVFGISLVITGLVIFFALRASGILGRLKK